MRFLRMRKIRVRVETNKSKFFLSRLRFLIIFFILWNKLQFLFQGEKRWLERAV